MRELTLKQRAFADYYIKLGNATEAYIRAGYKVKGRNVAEVEGHKSLRNHRVRRYVDERLKQIDDSRIADAAEVMKYLTAVLRGKSESKIVVVEGTGEGRSKARQIKKAPDEKERLRAAELLGKRYSIFTEKVDMSVSIPVVISGEDALED
ncbi:MAG: terminase small subunit [Alkaliphilus sp.]